MRTRLAAPRHALTGLGAALVLCLAAAPAFANGDDAVDPVLQLLAEKGLLADPASASETTKATEATSAAKPSLLRQVHDRASDLTMAAMNLVGVRYRRGGTSTETGFDCSGFTRHVFETSLGAPTSRQRQPASSQSGAKTFAPATSFSSIR